MSKYDSPWEGLKKSLYSDLAFPSRYEDQQSLERRLLANEPPSCPHTYSRIKFDGGRRAVVCNSCSVILTHLREE